MTAREKSENIIVKYRQRYGFLLKRETTGFEIQTRDVRNPPEALIGPLKGTVSRLCAHLRIICSFLKRQTVILTRQDFLLDRTADGDLLVTFSNNILDFRRSPSPYL